MSQSKQQKGVVSGGHTATVEAGSAILSAGGNAFDAMLASLFASFVAEPCMSSPGGGLFILYKTAAGQSVLIDGFCQTPIRKRSRSSIDFLRVPIDFGTVTEDFYAGAGAVAVPGAIAAACELQRTHASMPLKELLEPAIQLAREGLQIDSFQAYDFKLLEPILRMDLQSAADFFHSGSLQVDQSKAGQLKADQFKVDQFKAGQLKKESDHIRLPELADFLENLGHEGEDLFYKGEISRQIDACCKEKGQIQRSDLQTYQAINRQPLGLKQWGWEILSNPAPSGGGSMILLLQALLEKQLADRQNEQDAHIAEALAAVTGLRAGNSVPGMSAALAKLTGSHIFDPTHKHLDIKKWGSTSHINTSDAAGNTVSLTSSNGEGSGLWVSGIQLNNMLGEAALFPSGFQSWKENVRIASLMSPTIACKGKHTIALGSGGASRIPAAIGQTLYHLLRSELSLQQSIAAPRMHWQEGKLNLEGGINKANFSKALQQKVVEWESLDMYFGGVHAISNNDGLLQGVGDDRRNGCASIAI